jgi:hypothetical protein
LVVVKIQRLTRGGSLSTKAVSLIATLAPPRDRMRIPAIVTAESGDRDRLARSSFA